MLFTRGLDDGRASATHRDSLKASDILRVTRGLNDSGGKYLQIEEQLGLAGIAQYGPWLFGLAISAPPDATTLAP